MGQYWSWSEARTVKSDTKFLRKFSPTLWILLLFFLSPIGARSQDQSLAIVDGFIIQRSELPPWAPQNDALKGRIREIAVLNQLERETGQVTRSDIESWKRQVGESDARTQTPQALRLSVLRKRMISQLYELAIGKERLNLMLRWGKFLRKYPSGPMSPEDEKKESLSLLRSSAFAALQDDFNGLYLNRALRNAQIEILAPELKDETSALLAPHPDPTYLKSRLSIEDALKGASTGSLAMQAWATLSILEAGVTALDVLSKCAPTKPNCLHILAAIDTDRARRLIHAENLYKSTADGVALMAFAILAESNSNELFQILSATIADGETDPSVRRTAMEYCGNGFGARCIPILKGIRKDKRADIREEALRSLHLLSESP